MKPYSISKTPRVTSIFAGIKSMSWGFIVLATAFVFGLITAVNKNVHDEHDFFVALYKATGGLLNPTLLGSGLMAILIIAGLIGFGRLSLRDFGWKWENLVPGVAATVVLWITMQLVEVIANFASIGEFQFSPSWGALGGAAVVGVLLGQVLGTATAEETYFRGFLLPQLRLKFGGMNAGLAVALAIVASQLVFSLYHLPNLILGNSGEVGTGFVDIVTQLGLDFAIGVVFAAVYVRTGNLFLVMGIHALQNAGTSIVATPIDPSQVMLTLAIIVFLATFAPGVVRRLHGAAPTQQLPSPIPS